MPMTILGSSGGTALFLAYTSDEYQILVSETKLLIERVLLKSIYELTIITVYVACHCFRCAGCRLL